MILLVVVVVVDVSVIVVFAAAAVAAAVHHLQLGKPTRLVIPCDQIVLIARIRDPNDRLMELNVPRTTGELGNEGAELDRLEIFWSFGEGQEEGGREAHRHAAM